MVDKVKPLKLESSSTGGTENDPYPTEVDPTEDYVATKGLSFENSDDYLYEKLGGVLLEKFPTTTWVPAYTGAGEIDYIEFFNDVVQTTPNRIARVDVIYDGSLNPTSETWVVYDTADGTTVLRTITYTYTWSSFDLTLAEVVTT